MPSDRRAGPAPCWKSTLRRRPLELEFPISPKPLASVLAALLARGRSVRG
jgi:hypothetical protein